MPPLKQLGSVEDLRVRKIQFARSGAPKDPDRRRRAQEEEGRMTPPLCPFVRQGFLHLLSNVMRS